MKSYYIVFLIVIGTLSIKAQNIQLHYDLGEDRKMFTSTVEMFKPDKFGNTFFFIDFDYGSESSNVKGISLAYWEIARVIKTEKMPIGVHVEYNAGFGRFNNGTQDVGFRLSDAWLAGVDYSLNAKDFSKGISFKVLYKHIVDKHDASFQLTTVWYWQFLNKKITFSGFADFWMEESDFDFDGSVDAKYIFLAEPQIWYNFNEKFSAGGEIELSNNFGGNNGFMVNPTLAVKYAF